MMAGYGWSFVACLLVVCFVQGLLAASGTPPEVTVAGGALLGSWKQSRQGRDIAAFEGIPYAKPPVGELRFQAPEPAEPWSGVRSAAAPGQVCPQIFFLNRSSIVGDEDCLFLNVYAPNGVSPSSPLDVMVWIHGGAFLEGSGSMYEPQYFLDEDVILVTINYRLGVLGFLSTGDDVLPGNNGLKDQVQALRWVRENIASFGGNPNSVTIFGESAGAASVHLLMMSPLAKGLFHRAISQSGNALASWAVAAPGEEKRNSKILADRLNCPVTPSEELVKCLGAKSAKEIVAAGHNFVENMLTIPFKPTVEHGKGAFMNRHPYEILKTGSQPSDVPFINGFTSEEGSFIALGLFMKDDALQMLNKNFNSVMSTSLIIDGFPQPQLDKTLTKARKFYFGEGPLKKEQIGKAIELYSDVMFFWPTLQGTKLQATSGKSPVYVYEFAYRGSFSAASLFSGVEGNFGVSHGDDLLYLFPVAFIFPNRKPSAEDEAVSKSFVKLFTNFARNGRPTEDGSWQAVKQPDQAEYLYISSAGGNHMRSNFSPKRMAFWKDAPIKLARAPVQRDEL